MLSPPFPEEEISDYIAHGPIIRVTVYSYKFMSGSTLFFFFFATTTLRLQRLLPQPIYL